jgi:hypothetical protein
MSGCRKLQTQLHVHSNVPQPGASWDIQCCLTAGLLHYQQNRDCSRTAKYTISYNSDDPQTVNQAIVSLPAFHCGMPHPSTYHDHVAPYVRQVPLVMATDTSWLLP